jgi:hypothetical protein
VGPLDAVLRLVAGRLVAGRLDEDHTPAGVDVIGALTLDDLRKMFSGYRRHRPAETN